MPSLSTGWGQGCTALCPGFLYPAGNGTSPSPPGLGAFGRRRLLHIPAGWNVRGCQEWTQISGAHYQHYNGSASRWLQQIKFSVSYVQSVNVCSMIVDVSLLKTLLKNTADFQQWLLQGQGPLAAQTGTIPRQTWFQDFRSDKFWTLHVVIWDCPYCTQCCKFLYNVCLSSLMFLQIHMSDLKLLRFFCFTLLLRQFQTHTRKAPEFIKAVRSA